MRTARSAFVSRGGGIAAAALTAAVLAAGCGGEQSSSEATAAESDPQAEVRQLYAPEGVSPVGAPAPGDMLQYADCYDWNDGSRDEKVATVVALREQLTPQGSADTTSPLDDVLAFQRLERTCTEGTQSLRLYKLYVRMQAYGAIADSDLG